MPHRLKVHNHCMIMIFGAGTHPLISPVIKMRTGSNYSHVAYVDPLTGLIIESAGGIGVRVVTFEQFTAKYPRYHIGFTVVPCAMYARQFVIHQLGKPYDDFAIWGYLFGRDWNDPSAWTCSEILAAAGATARKGMLNFISPQHLYLHCKPVHFRFDYFQDLNLLTPEEIKLSSPEFGDTETIEAVKTKLLLHGESLGWPSSVPNPRLSPVIYPKLSLL